MSNSKSTHLQIHNWRKYQHYTNRCPPWIKFHSKILDKPEWRSLTDAMKGQLAAIWVLAARLHDAPDTDAAVPNSPAYLAALTGCKITGTTLQTLTDKGFLVPCKQDASAPLAKCYTETETETYKEERETEAIPPTLQSHGFPDKWAQWLDYRRGQRWSVRAPWQSRQLAMLAKHGPGIAAAALDASMDQGWQGVFPEKVPTKRCAPELDTSGPVRIADSAGYYRCHCGFQAPRAEVYAHIKAKHSSTEKIA